MIRQALFAVVVILPALETPLHAQPLTGQATVIDGDTIEIHQQRIRLSGIDAPESDQLCRGDDSLPYRCGAKPANELDRFIADRPVSCIDIDERTYNRVVAVCTVGGVDLADWMARQGLAFDWPKYSKGGYAAAQSEAKKARSDAEAYRDSNDLRSPD